MATQFFSTNPVPLQSCNFRLVMLVRPHLGQFDVIQKEIDENGQAVSEMVTFQFGDFDQAVQCAKVQASLAQAGIS